MAQYIPKEVLLAEIEELVDKGKCHEEYDYAYRDGNNGALYALRNKLNTLEVKEVDFGTEVYKYIDEHFNVYDDGNQTLQTKDKKSLIGRVDVENIAKHFFELGMSVSNKVKKGE